MRSKRRKVGFQEHEKCPHCGSIKDYNYNYGSNYYQWCDSCGWSLAFRGVGKVDFDSTSWEESIPQPCYGCGQEAAPDLCFFGSYNGFSGGSGVQCMGSGCDVIHAESGSPAVDYVFEEYISEDKDLAEGLPEVWEDEYIEKWLEEARPGLNVRLARVGSSIVIAEISSGSVSIVKATVESSESRELKEWRKDGRCCFCAKEMEATPGGIGFHDECWPRGEK